jgi:hypothetical protein
LNLLLLLLLLLLLIPTPLREGRRAQGERDKERQECSSLSSHHLKNSPYGRVKVRIL